MSKNLANDELRFIDPTAGTGRPVCAPAARPMDLAGKTVGLLDNTKEQGALILETLGRALREQHGAANVLVFRKEHYSKPAPDALLDDIARKVQVAIAALGG